VTSNWRQKERYAYISDSIALGHFVVCNVILVLGAITHLFDFMHHAYPGLEFVYTYIDRPVYQFLKHLDAIPSDPFFTYVVGEMVIAGSSFLYWVISYITLKAFFAFFE
jgi:hypothetical protein